MAEQTSRLAVIIDSSGAQKNTETLASSLAKLTQAGQKAADGAGKVTKATEDEAQALSNLLDRIDPVNAALNKLDAQQKNLSSFKAKGFLDTETFEHYNSLIDASRNKLTTMSTQMVKTGQSAKQTAFAMRMIPAQMTDIVVGLSTGQSPFMVLMQQGGQLKDMFGGIGPAIKGVGGYVAGLINPFTLAAAAAATLGLAYYQGADEQEQFRKSLILTGNQVGKTSDQLSDMASSISNATGTTQGNASAVLNQVVMAGGIAGDSLEKVSAAIVNISQATGEATDKIVTDFQSIASDPVAAITKLNDQYHFLTLATYNQIKALQDEGDQQDAARVATDAYANAMNGRAKDIHENLGYLETAWDALGNSAKSAWDKMLNIGREETLSQRLEDARKQASNAAGSYTGGGLGSSVANDMLQKQGQQTVNILQYVIDLQGDVTGAVAAGNVEEQKSIKTLQEADKVNQQYLTNAERRNKAIQQQSDFLKAGAINAQQYAHNVSQINQMYKDPAEPKQRAGKQPKAYSEDADQKLLDQINQQTAALTTQLNTTDKLSSVTQQRLKFEQQIAEIKGKSQLTADQKSLLANYDAIDQAYKRQELIQNQVTTLDHYRKMQEQVRSKDQQQNDLLADRLKLLDKAKAAGAHGTDATRADIYKNTPITMPSSVTSAIGSLQPTGGELSGSFAGLSAQYGGLDKAQNDLKTWLQSQEDAYAKAGDITQAGEDRMNKIRQEAALANQQIEAQKTEIISSSTQSMMDSTVSIMQDGFGKQSAAYKVAFAASKAFAIADSMVKIQQAIASGAVSGPYPANIIAMASIAAQTASIVSSISSVSATGFQSGGYTGNGGVSVPAGIVHGQEFVMDAGATRRIGVSNLEAIRKNGLDATLSRSGFGTGAKNVNNSNQSSTTNHFSIQQTFTGKPDDSTLLAINSSNQRMAKEIENKLTKEIINPQGQFGRSLKGYYSRSYRE
ncbi:phage tail length tape measure family protein [Tatumella sp. OPLPL6]|uniref:phage tail length tape measure family protein n=1 Tax=Tatumella sp. OPLPL6 TaxID=1928657 RepID=UPI000C180903|nr:phage tail length tape measure family protein [Tatumella sp. OPLPL6]PIJ42842.1 phage tail protein [Tatumella sp. OPLPL6]